MDHLPPLLVKSHKRPFSGLMVHSHSTSLSGLTAVSRSIQSHDKAENEFSAEQKLVLGSQRCLWTCGFPSAGLGVFSKPLFTKCLCFNASRHKSHWTPVSAARSLPESIWGRGGLGGCVESSTSCPHWISTPSRVAALWVKVKQLYSRTATSKHSKPWVNGAKYSRRNFSNANTNLLLR